MGDLENLESIQSPDEIPRTSKVTEKNKLGVEFEHSSFTQEKAQQKRFLLFYIYIFVFLVNIVVDVSSDYTRIQNNFFLKLRCT